MFINEQGLENLSNAVVIQAAKDYRIHMGFLKRHPRTPELTRKVEADRKERREKIASLMEERKEHITEIAFSQWLTKHDEGETFDREAYKRSVKVRVPKSSFPPTKSERLLEKIERNEKEASDIERFFLSKWYTLFTDVDGGALLSKLKEEFADESD